MSIEYVYPTGNHRLELLSGAREKSPAASGADFFGKDGFSFKDILDSVNPLQQLPGVGTIYRELTGDVASAASKLAGGALLGGPLGFALALADTIFESGTGKDLGSTLLALVTGESETQLADNTDYAPSPTNRAAYQAYQQRQSIA